MARRKSSVFAKFNRKITKAVGPTSISTASGAAAIPAGFAIGTALGGPIGGGIGILGGAVVGAGIATKVDEEFVEGKKKLLRRSRRK